MDKKLVYLLALSVLIAGCATGNHFYGIGMNSVGDAKDFKITSYIDGVVRYKDNNKMNSNISAWAKVNFWDSSYDLVVKITNNTFSPIHTNYFTDTFSLVTKEGKKFHLEKGNITRYHNGAYINPGNTAYYSLDNPFRDYKQLVEETSMIICEIGTAFNRVKVVLKPLPGKETIPDN